MMAPLLLVLCLFGQSEEFDAAKVNKLIVSLSEDPSQESKVGELHDYLKKHGKLALIYAKFEESFERRPKDAKLRYLLGRLQLRDGNRAAALKWFQAAAQADPDFPYTYLAQAELCREQGDEKGLVAALEGVIQSCREKPAVAGAVRQLTAFYARKQDLERVASLWAGVTERFADDAELLEEAIRGISATGRLARARECLRAALSRKFLPPADRARLYLELAGLERRTGSPSEAARALAAASEAAGDDAALGRKIDESILAFHREENKLTELAEQRMKELQASPADPVRIWRAAKVFLAQNSPLRAREILMEGLKLQVGHPLLLAALADVAAQQGRVEELRDLARELVRREPTQREHRKRLGLACLELAAYDEAEQAFAAFAVTGADFAELGQIYERRQRLADAAKHFARSVELRPDPAMSRTLVGIYVRLDRPADAEKEATRCTSSDRERWALLRELLRGRGDLANACAYAKKDADANPKDFGAQLALGKLLAAVKHSDAERTLRRAAELGTKRQRGEAYEELAALVASQSPAALQLLRAELRAKINEEPDEGGYYYALYRLPSGPDGRGANPMKILEEGRSRDERHVRLRQELAPYYVQQKQYDVAIDVYRELLQIDPARQDLYSHAIGEIYWSLGHKEEAFSWWAKVSGASKDKVGLQFQLAKKYESEKRYPQAIELLEKIIREEPDGILYHWALAQLYRQVNSFEGIEREFTWILAHAKDEGYLRTARQLLSEKLCERARALAEQGKNAEALEVFAEGLRYAPDEPAIGSVLAHMARICEQLRNPAKAVEYYHALLSKYPTVIVTVSPGRTMNAALFASLQLRGNPECLQAYEDAVGAAAKALLLDALQKGDRAALERVIASYPLTQAAGIAAYSLGEAYRRDGDRARAVGYYERLLAEFSFATVDEALVRIRIVELASQLKDWGLLSLHVGELAARFKDKVLTVDGKTVAVKDVIKGWQKELLVHGVGLGATWGLIGKDSRNSSAAIQELSPPLLAKWKCQVYVPRTGIAQGLPPVYVSNGLVLVTKEDQLVALEASSGSVRWSAPLRVVKTRPKGGDPWMNGSALIEGRLAIAQGVVLGVDSDNELRAFEVATGGALWTHSTDVPRAEGLGPAKAGTRVRTGVSLGFVDHLDVISATRQSFLVREGDKLRAYSIRTGRMDWQTDVQAGALPLALDPGPPGNGQVPQQLERWVLESDGVLIHAYGDAIRALDTLSGRDLWEVKLPPRTASSNNGWTQYFKLVTDGVARASISGDLLVYVAAATGKLTALELRSGKLRWDVAGDSASAVGQLASDDQYVYSLRTGSLAVFSAKTGERIWNRELRQDTPANQPGLPAVITTQNRLSVAGTRLFFISNEDPSEGAKLEIIDRKNGTSVWHYSWEPIGKLLSGFRVLGTDAWGRPIPIQTSAPVICDGWMYVVRSDGFLYAFHGKTQELASLREAIRLDPDSPMAHFRLGDLLGSEGSTSLEIEEYRTALRLAAKKPETTALKEMIAEAKSRLFVRFMRQGETTPDLEAALKAFAEARAVAEGEASLSRALVRTAAVLLALKRDLEAIDALSSILTFCPAYPSPLEGAPETAGEYAKRQLAKLGPQARAQWEKAHAEEMEKAFAASRSVEDLEKAIEKYSFSAKADQARIRAARVHLDQKRYKDAVLALDKVRPEFLEQADAETFFDAYDLLGRALAALGEDRRALGTYQKLISEIAKDEARLGAVRSRAEARHKELKESWERNGTFSTPLQTVWASPAPLAGAPKPAGPTMDAFRPVVDCGKIYVLGLQGNLQATDTATTEVVWQGKTEDFASFLQASNNLVVLPLDPLMAVRNGLLVVGGKTVRAFDAASGKPLWTMPSVDPDGFAHQVVLEGNRVVTCETKGRVTVREDRTGKLLWSNRPGASASGIISDRSNSCGGGLVYSHVGVEGARVVVQPAGDPGNLHAYDLFTGKLVWKMVDGSYPGYLKGRVILEVGFGAACFADPTGLVVCHDLVDGKVRWKLNLSLPVESLLATPDRIVVATSEQLASYGSKNGKKDWGAALETANQPFPRDKDMRIGATSLDAKGRWLVVGSAVSVSIYELATGQLKDQVRPDAPAAPAKPAGRVYPFGKSFVSVAVGPEGIFWGLPTESFTQWSLLR
jgi:outer membrane protein assembly factor BamB/tetratricopeptide (TPR) repeat protein